MSYKLKLFGTDGIRGCANSKPMTAEMVLQVGLAAGSYFTRGKHRHNVVIGKDTRLSGYMIEQALSAGFIAMGMNVNLLGPLPTPAVAMLTRSLRADLGVMISASHNLYQDNGIKLFGPDGYKLSDEAEGEIEVLVEEGVGNKAVVPEKLGRLWRMFDAQGRYIEFAKNTFPKGMTLDGLKVVIDCAHGAAYRVATTVLRELGAVVSAIGVNPDGTNINLNCGSTVPERMCDMVRRENADIGIALDGDADRVVIADEQGHLLDGDQLMALVADQMHSRGQLRGAGLVATQMSNLGLERYLSSIGLHLARTRIGDRYVMEHMRKHGYNLGGEQSGHIILADHTTTGDGLIVALKVLSLLVESEKPASKACRVFTPLPQVLRNVAYKAGNVLDHDEIRDSIASAERQLAGSGRLLVRRSGTEGKIRIMAEGEDETLVRAVIDEVAGAIEQHAG
ncbi:MAG: phosphoglucosamine mutase [Alphaproteobacteria bacterium]